MTEKAALAGLAQGGGKAVIIGDPNLVKTPGLLRDFAAAVNSLGGRYVTAEDVGTTQDDMDQIRESTPFVAGTAISRGGSGDPSSATALGVVVAMEAAAAHRWGDDLKGRTVCVVGAGKVGGEVIRLLVQRRAVVIAAEVNVDKAEAAVRTGAVRLIDPSDAPGATVDILCPCALGGCSLKLQCLIFTVRSLWARQTISSLALRSRTHSQPLAYSTFLTFWRTPAVSSTSPRKPMAMTSARGEGRRSDPGHSDPGARASRGARHHSPGCGRGAGGPATCWSRGQCRSLLRIVRWRKPFATR